MQFGTPYWWQDGAALPKLPSTPPDRADILIIGAGFTGLTAAITAAKEGASVLVVDAQIPGQGASTRNGGMAGAHPRMSLAAASKKFGAATAEAMFAEADPAFDHLKSLIKDNEIDCDYQQTGRVQLAWTRADFAAQKALVADMNNHVTHKVQVLEKDDLKDHISTDQYYGGIYFANHGAVQPRKLHDGLMATALNAGVEVVQNCPIHAVTRSGTGFVATHAGGEIRAKKVLMATNGYTKGKGALAWLSRHVYPLPSYIIATEKLSPNLIGELAPGGRMMVETRARHSYFRVSPDGTRILWGGRASIRQVGPELAAQRLRQSMEEIWPALKGVKITHAWKGNTGFSFEQSPRVGTHDGVHFAVGYCGGGVVLAPYLGMKAAYQMLGDPRGQTAYGEVNFTSRPYHLGGWPWFLDVADAWYKNVVDPRQSAQARRDRH